MAAIIEVYVGIPENDKRISVSADSTVSQVLQSANVSAKGMIQHNGQSLATKDLNKTLQELGVVSDDTLYVVSKMDGAIL